MKNSVLILDFGAQYTQLIARRVRELGVYSEIRPFDVDFKVALQNQPAAIILSGGPCSVTDSGSAMIAKEWFSAGIPILGLCYGMQLMGHLLGGKVLQGARREYGPANVEIQREGALFDGFQKGEKTAVWMSHGDHVEEVPAGFEITARSEDGVIAAMGDSKRKLFATQFHPEVAHTPRGKEMLRNFIFHIARAEKNWDSTQFLRHTIEQIKETVPDNANVVCGLSGGVDSTIASIIVNQAIGERLHCILVDNGLMRKGEAQEICKRLGREEGGFGLNLKVVDASERFLAALKGVTEPEKKRKIIGHVFIDIFNEEAQRISNVTHLVQGTLYPDVIESLSVKGPSATIKTHHNVGGLPKEMLLKLIEPFRELFKDEVRRVGAELGAPQEILERHPFPGPGLAVRVLGEVTPDRLRVVREADRILQEEVVSAGVYRELWQCFCVLLPVKSVGVMGDCRTYDEVVAIRAVMSEDGMTADWNYLPEEMLRRTSRRIINEVKGVNRVVLDISSKPPATIEWE